MNVKRLILTFVVVFVLLEALGYLVHNVILSSAYSQEGVSSVFRSEEAMTSNMWVMWVVDLVWSFFFTLIFVKGYEGKGWVEGLKFGIYIGIFWSFTNAYSSYVIYPLPYSLIIQWFIYGFIVTVILGIVAGVLYKPAEVKAEASTETAPSS